MWVSPAARGLGLAGDCSPNWRRTPPRGGSPRCGWRRTHLAEAISLYRSSGYREVAAFSDEPYAHHWFEKKLDHNAP